MSVEESAKAGIPQVVEKFGLTAASWQAVVDQLKQMPAPTLLTELHTQLTDSVISIQATLAELPVLFKSKNQSAFSAKQKELESKMAGLQALSEPLQAVMKPYSAAVH